VVVSEGFSLRGAPTDMLLSSPNRTVSGGLGSTGEFGNPSTDFNSR